MVLECESLVNAWTSGVVFVVVMTLICSRCAYFFLPVGSSTNSGVSTFIDTWNFFYLSRFSASTVASFYKTALRRDFKQIDLICYSLVSGAETKTVNKCEDKT